MSTVFHAVNGTRRVNAGTRAAVVDAIRELGFIPDAVAQSLARSATNAVGIALSASANSCFMDIVCAVEAACGALGQMVLLANTKDDPDTEHDVVRALHQRRVDGIILTSSADPERRAIRDLAGNKVPCVLVE